MKTSGKKSKVNYTKVRNINKLTNKKTQRITKYLSSMHYINKLCWLIRNVSVIFVKVPFFIVIKGFAHYG